MARRVTAEEGILIGGSGGTAVAAALEVGKDLGPDHLVVVLIPDSGRGYLSRVFDDDWMAGFGFLHSDGRTVADVIRGARRRRPAARVRAPGRHRAPRREPHARPRRVAAAGGEGRAAAGRRGGARRGRRAGADGPRDPRRRACSTRPVEKVMGPRLPTIGIGQPLELAVEMLDTAPALVVLAGGRPHVVLSAPTCCASCRGDT